MIRETILLIILFYFLTLLQTSFLVQFFGFVPNFVLIGVALINLLEDQKSALGIIAGVVAGFFLDIFSENFIGFYTLLSLFLSLFIKLVAKDYLHINFSLKPKKTI